MSNIPISNVTRRQVFAASSATTFAFTFEVLSETDISVFSDDTQLELSTNYTVTLNSATGTGQVNLSATPVGVSQIAVIGNRAIQRTTDFTTGGDFNAKTLNDELDSLTIFAQQNAEGLQRTLIAPQTDPAGLDMTLPRVSDRANKYLAFGSAGEAIGGAAAVDISGIQDITAEISALGGLSSELTTLVAYTAQLTNLGSAQAIANLSAVGAIANEVSVVSTMKTDIDNVLDSTAEISTAASLSTALSTFAGIGTADIATVASYGTATLTGVASQSANITQVASLSAEITAVSAASYSALMTNAVGMSANISQVLSQSAEITQVASQSAEITGVFNIRANVTTAANNASAISSNSINIGAISAVSTNITNVNSVAAIAPNVTTVASAIDSVNTVATNVSATIVFGQTYLGALNTAPGSAIEGALYWNSSADKLYVFDSSAWSQAAFEISSTGVLSVDGETGHVVLSTAQLTAKLDNSYEPKGRAVAMSLVFS
jgi:hypothetical protein